MTYLGDDRRAGLITYDTAHLTPAGSIHLADGLLAPRVLAGVR